MDKIMKAYIFRMYPDESQISLIEKSFGCSRFIYNHFLGLGNKYINKFDYIKQIPLLVMDNNWLVW